MAKQQLTYEEWKSAFSAGEVEGLRKKFSEERLKAAYDAGISPDEAICEEWISSVFSDLGDDV